jgi:anti-sigma factor RsiW
VNTPDESLPLDAFVDGALDLKSQLALERRLQTDPALRKKVDELRQLRALVREHASYHPAPPALRARLAATASAPPARDRQRSAALQRWFGWRPLAASLGLATVLAVAVNIVWLQSTREDHLADEVVASHVRATLGQHLVDVSSSDHHTVKPFLSARLGFSPPVNELALPGSVFLGGRIDYLGGRTVAALVYRQGEHIVNLFVWPGPAADSPPQLASQRGYLTAHWSHAGMTHWLISDVNREEFGAVVKAIEAAETAR